MSFRFGPWSSLPFPKARAPRRRRAREASRSTSCALPHPWRSFPGPRLGRGAGGPIFGDVTSLRRSWSRARRFGPAVGARRAGNPPRGTRCATGLPALTPRATHPAFSRAGASVLSLARRAHAPSLLRVPPGFKPPGSKDEKRVLALPPALYPQRRALPLPTPAGELGPATPEPASFL